MLYLVKRSLRTKVFAEVCHGIAFDLHGCGTPGETGRGSGVNAGSVVHKVGSEGGILDLMVLQIPGQLVNDGSDHFQVSQFFNTCKGGKMEPAL